MGGANLGAEDADAGLPRHDGAMGFRTPHTRTHPISHPTLISHIAWKRIGVKPGIASIAGQEVRFVDGTAETFDAIIAATGYVTEFPYLPKDYSPVTGTRLSLHNRVVHPALPGVFFIGFFDVSGGSNIRMMDDQAEYIASIAIDAVKLPSRREMEAAIARDHAWAKQQFPDSPRYGLELDRTTIARSLRESIVGTESSARSRSN
jgi:hypothetical protein